MSSILHRDLWRLERAAAKAGITNLTKFWSPKDRKWIFHLRGDYKGRPIVLVFDPSSRGAGGSTPKKTKSFKEKLEWANSHKYLVYIAERDHSTTDMTFHIKLFLLTSSNTNDL